MRLIGLDAETYFSKEYSLTRMGTAAYIRDPQFKAHGWAVKDGRAPSRWLSHDQFVKFAADVDWPNTAIYGHNCVDGDTEVLTRDGWVRFEDYDGRDIVQVDPASMRAEFVRPSAVVRKPYDGKVYEWNTLYHKGLYTPDHRMVISTPDRTGYMFATAAEAASKGQNNTYVLTSCQLGGTLGVSEDEARLLEAVRADAHIADAGNSIRFKLSKQRKIDRLLLLCASVGVPVSQIYRPDGVSDIALLAHPLRDRIVALLGTAKNKSLGSWVLDLPLSSKLAMIDEATFWDGCSSRGTKSSFSVATAVGEDAYWMQVLAHTSLNSMAYSTRGNARGYNAHNASAVLHQGTVRAAERAKLVEKPTLRDYNGIVYCVTVPTGAFMVRRHGAVWVTGNCLFDGAILAWRYGIKPSTWVDTLGMARAVLGPVLKSFSLDSVGEHLGFGGKVDKGKALKDVMGVRDLTHEQFNRLGVYARGDIDLTHNILEHCAERFPENEYEILDWTIRCFTEPAVLINQRTVANAMVNEEARRARLLAEVNVPISDLRSDKTFAGILEALGIDPPRKVSKRTGKKIYAFAKTDEPMVAMLEDENPYVRALVEARMGVKTSIVQTRLNSLKVHGETNKGRFSCGIGFSGAHTHRFSAMSGGKKGGLNILNFPRDGDLNATLEAPKGWLIVNADSSQIEARLAMWQAGETDILTAFRDKKDPYCIFASRVYGKPVTKADKGERFIGKQGMLGLQYGASHLTFQNTCRVQGRAQGLPKEMWTLDEEFCQQVVRTYRREYPGIPAIWRSLDKVIEHIADEQVPPQPCKAIEFTKTGYVLPSGLEVNYHDLRMHREPGAKKPQFHYKRINKQSSHDRQRIYGAAMLENICQSLAREAIVADQLVTINRELRVVWQVYDSIVCLIPEGEKDVWCGWIEDVMNTPPAWAQQYDLQFPIACEVGVGRTYAEAKKSEWKRPEHMRRAA